MIKVSKEVLDGLEFIRENGKVNVFDYLGVSQETMKHGYNKTAIWIMQNQEEYNKGIFEGFKEEE